MVVPVVAPVVVVAADAVVALVVAAEAVVSPVVGVVLVALPTGARGG